MFTITILFKPVAAKFIVSRGAPLAGLDGDVTVVDIDDDEEDNAGIPVDPQLREIIAGARAEAMHEFLKETPHF